ncbi:MAG: hypothetical protein ACOC2Y_02140 [Spirochaetota bacterium]
MKHRFAAALLLVVASFAGADEEHWELRLGPRIWGFNLGARYMIEPATVETVETSITGLLSAAYQGVNYYRAPDGALVTPDFPPDDTGYSRADLIYELGLQQGILPRADSEADLAVGFLLYRGQYDYPFANDTLFFQSPRPETAGSWRGSFVGGAAYSSVTTDPVTRVTAGSRAELAIEWGPAFLHNQILGEADYNRTTLSARAYAPLLTVVPTEGRNVFSSFLALYGEIDWITGPEIPDIIRSTTGGRSMRPAPGGSIRGYGNGRFDSTFKIVTNADLRLMLPAIVLPSIVPGIVLYTDAGYFSDAERLSPNEADHSGFLLTSGAGLSIDMFNAVALVFYTNYLWLEPSVSGDRWVPFGLGFGFHF